MSLVPTTGGNTTIYGHNFPSNIQQLEYGNSVRIQQCYPIVPFSVFNCIVPGGENGWSLILYH